MSERILKALMQLFAILAKPDSNADERKEVVRSFLKQQLNQELIENYLSMFDGFFDQYQKRQGSETKQRKRLAASSVKVIMIATVINQELTQKEKIIVLVRLIEFVTTVGEIPEQENEFVTTVSDTFNIDRITFEQIKTFVVDNFVFTPDWENLLVIDSNQHITGQRKVKRIFVDSFKGQIRVLKIDISSIYLMRFVSESELYLNGQLLQDNKVYLISSGSSIRSPQLKPIYYSDIVGNFSLDISKPRVVLEANNIHYTFKGGKVGLHNISFVEKSGKLIGIMGASGTGKSTLLNVLNGSEKPNHGEVLINGVNIHKEPHKIEGLIGHVSQDDLLIEDLTVFENLYYNAKLCFSNYTHFQILRSVVKVLQNLGLYEIKDMKVGNPLNKKISGGQRKRLNIALELIREPAVLFLDEPTSGLSSRDSENILDLLKELALKGKLVFVVIHQPSSDIFKMFDRLLLLDQAGFLIYNGDPVDSIIYFKSRIHQANWSESECHTCGNVNPEQIFNIVEAKVIDEYGHFTKTRKVSPKEWHQYFLDYTRNERRKSVLVRDLPELSFKIPNAIRQFWVFVTRDVLAKLANKQYLFINLIESPLLAFILSYIIKYYNVDAGNQYGYTLMENSNLPVYLFMAVIVALFIGLTVSAQEIIKDRRILKREQFLHLSRTSYLWSKIFILFTLSAFQSLVFVIIGNSILEIKGMYIEYWLVLFSVWAFANILGLNISDSFQTSVTIHILIPFLIIPQIILSGIIVKYDKLNPNISSPNSIPIYGEIITARWAYEALAVYQFMSNDYEQQFYELDKQMSIAEYKKNYWLKTLENKLTEIERNYKNPDKKEEVISDLELIRNELEKELQVNYSKKLDLSLLYHDKVSSTALQSVEAYFMLLKKHYINMNNLARKSKDAIITEIESDKVRSEEFLKLKREHYNERLNDFVTNSDELISIIEYKQHLYQKTDPVFQVPDHSMIKAHFYAPQKKIFGFALHTYWVNVLVIWLFSAMLYFMLQFRILSLIVDGIDRINIRLKEKLDK